MCKFEEFVEVIKEEILNYLPEEYENAIVNIRKENKNNGTVLTGLMVFTKGQRVTPNVYLESYHREYESGKTLVDVLEKIAKCIVESSNNAVCHMPAEAYDISSYENVKDRIYFRLINAEMNRNILTERPHRLVEDLAVVYCVKVFDEGERLGSIFIENKFLERWSVDEETLYLTALKNTPELFPAVFTRMEDILSGVFETNERTRYSIDELEVMAECPEFFPKLYVISNASGVNGASVILYPNVLARIEEVLGDVIMFPSSIHEWIIVKADESTAGINALEDLVRFINDTQVSVEDRLAYHVYRPVDGKLKMITQEAEKVAAAE